MFYTYLYYIMMIFMITIIIVSSIFAVYYYTLYIVIVLLNDVNHNLALRRWQYKMDNCKLTLKKKAYLRHKAIGYEVVKMQLCILSNNDSWHNTHR